MIHAANPGGNAFTSLGAKKRLPQPGNLYRCARLGCGCEFSGAELVEMAMPTGREAPAVYLYLAAPCGHGQFQVTGTGCCTAPHRLWEREAELRALMTATEGVA